MIHMAYDHNTPSNHHAHPSPCCFGAALPVRAHGAFVAHGRRGAACACTLTANVRARIPIIRHPLTDLPTHAPHRTTRSGAQGSVLRVCFFRLRNGEHTQLRARGPHRRWLSLQETVQAGPQLILARCTRDAFFIVTNMRVKCASIIVLGLALMTGEHLTIPLEMGLAAWGRIRIT